MTPPLFLLRRAIAAASLILLLILSAACRQTAVPTEGVEDAGREPEIYPDYTGLTIPPNIAPLNFEIKEPGDEYIVKVSGGGRSLTANGNLAKWDEDDWHSLLREARGDSLRYEVYARNEGKWKRFRFSNAVAPEEIDPWLSYRLIEPSYAQYGGIRICMRDLTSFQEEIFHNNADPVREGTGECINCHVPRSQYADQASLMHVRGHRGGTLVMAGDSIVKVDLHTEGTISAGVYPAWHPTLPLIAFSTNDTHQLFHDTGRAKVEVYDNASDIILYDMKTHRIVNATASPHLLETYPAWAADGKTLYYSVASYPQGVDSTNLADHYREIRYDIVSRKFDSASLLFSEPDTVVAASASGQSALLPRISPSGRFLLYSQAPFGSFHIWHPESDLRIKDLRTGADRPLQRANSSEADSYHSWASNSRWIVFSSRRDDGNYTRPYIAYISPSGEDSKAFILPVEDPDSHRSLMKSYNVPEFFKTRPKANRPDLLKALEGPQRKAAWH